MNEHARKTLHDLGVARQLIELLPESMPFVLKESRGTNDNLPPISASQSDVAALYVGRNRFLVALNPTDAQRYHNLTGARIAVQGGNKTTWRLIIQAEEALKPDVIPYFREAINMAIVRSSESRSESAARSGAPAPPTRRG